MAMTDGLGVTPVYNLDGGNNLEGGWLWVIFLFFLMGWGGNGFNGFGGNGSSQINNDFMYSNLSSQLRDATGQNESILRGLERGMCNTSYENFRNISNLSDQFASCCCTTQKELLVNRYEAEKNTSSIVDAIHRDGEATRAMMTNNTIQDLRDRLQNAEFNNSQCMQTASIINQIRPFPQPAYITCSPYGNSNSYCY